MLQRLKNKNHDYQNLIQNYSHVLDIIHSAILCLTSDCFPFQEISHNCSLGYYIWKPDFPLRNCGSSDVITYSYLSSYPGYFRELHWI